MSGRVISADGRHEDKHIASLPPASSEAFLVDALIVPQSSRVTRMGEATGWQEMHHACEYQRSVERAGKSLRFYMDECVGLKMSPHFDISLGAMPSSNTVVPPISTGALAFILSYDDARAAYRRLFLAHYALRQLSRRGADVYFRRWLAFRSRYTRAPISN